MPFKMDKEIAAGLEQISGGAPRPDPAPLGDIPTRRANMTALMSTVSSKIPADLTSSVTVTPHQTLASDSHLLQLLWFTPESLSSSTSPTSAILFTHGGGMISSSISEYTPLLRSLCHLSGIPIMSVEYRLAPEVRAPVPVTDAYAGLAYLHGHSQELNVDRSRIILMGDSAGGGIAASLAHYVKLRGGPAVAKQVLIYPMLDDRTATVAEEGDPNLAPFLLWRHADNLTAWGALLGEDRVGGEDVTPVEAAGRMTVEDARGLPSAYVDVGELDLFRDEVLEYARKLGKAGVPCEMHLLAGVPHAFEALVPEAHVSKWAWEQRLRVLRSV